MPRKKKYKIAWHIRQFRHLEAMYERHKGKNCWVLIRNDGSVIQKDIDEGNWVPNAYDNETMLKLLPEAKKKGLRFTPFDVFMKEAMQDVEALILAHINGE